LGYITDLDLEEVLEPVHATDAPLGGESIDGKKARNCTCCVHLRLEGKFVMGSVHPNRAFAPSASDSIEMISSGIFCVHPWSELIADPEEAEWTSSGVVSDRNCCVGIVLTQGESIADREVVRVVTTCGKVK
jgi:hypothetical protein